MILILYISLVAAVYVRKPRCDSKSSSLPKSDFLSGPVGCPLLSRVAGTVRRTFAISRDDEYCMQAAKQPIVSPIRLKAGACRATTAESETSSILLMGRGSNVCVEGLDNNRRKLSLYIPCRDRPTTSPWLMTEHEAAHERLRQPCKLLKKLGASCGLLSLHCQWECYRWPQPAAMACPAKTLVRPQSPRPLAIATCHSLVCGLGSRSVGCKDGVRREQEASCGSLKGRRHS